MLKKPTVQASDQPATTENNLSCSIKWIQALLTHVHRSNDNVTYDDILRIATEILTAQDKQGIITSAIIKKTMLKIQQRISGGGCSRAPSDCEEGDEAQGDDDDDEEEEVEEEEEEELHISKKQKKDKEAICSCGEVCLLTDKNTLKCGVPTCRHRFHAECIGLDKSSCASIQTKGMVCIFCNWNQYRHIFENDDIINGKRSIGTAACFCKARYPECKDCDIDNAGKSTFVFCATPGCTNVFHKRCAKKSRICAVCAQEE